jgi:hypothetical protein
MKRGLKGKRFADEDAKKKRRKRQTASAAMNLKNVLSNGKNVWTSALNEM